MKIIAIDPGNRWCGYARLYHKGTEMHTETGVLDRNVYSFPTTVKLLVPSLSKSWVVTEQYRTRMQGFNTFRDSETPMLIGAIRFYAEHKEMRWTEVPAGDPKLLENMPLGIYIDAWARHWPTPWNSAWLHARSAWRVLAQFMLSRPDMHPTLKQIYTTNTPKLEEDTLMAPRHDGLIAPAVRWVTR